MQRFTKAMFESKFPTDAACLDFLLKARWPNGIECVKCQKVTKHYRIRAKKAYGCEFCGTLVSPTADTIFHKSATPLRDWFYAMFLMASTRTGVSAKHLERELGVTYKTAWRMFTQIRKLMAEDLRGMGPTVEADETYIGGVRKGDVGKPGPDSNKTPVFGVVERGGRAKTQVIANVQTQTLMPLVWKHVPAYQGRTVYTDELSSYRPLTKLGYNHITVNHGAKQYVSGKTHTNTIEGFWSLVKRGISGANHAVSPKYLQSYLDSYTFRYNRRNAQQPMFLALLDRAPSLGR